MSPLGLPFSGLCQLPPPTDIAANNQATPQRQRREAAGLPPPAAKWNVTARARALARGTRLGSFFSGLRAAPFTLSRRHDVVLSGGRGSRQGATWTPGLPRKSLPFTR